MSNVRDFGARGDGKSDDTNAVNHAIQKGNGQLNFPRGNYIITKPLQIPLQARGPMHIAGEGGVARLTMNAAGPALHLVGTHKGTAAPDTVTAQVWEKERMPIIRDLEIVGGHAQADGIRLDGVIQPILQGLLLRQCRHGIHLVSRNRNVLISNCQIYDNRGVGVFLDRVNLHQIIIEGNHISYCKQGGIKISGSEIRNLQICSNDIEYNYDLKAKTSADVLFDCSNGTVREGTLAGNTIQAVESPGGANVRLIGSGAKDPNAVGLWTIADNLIGSQTTNIDLYACRSVTVTGNCIYRGFQHALRVRNAEHLVIANNSVDQNPQYGGQITDRIVLERCRNINFSGNIIQHTRPPKAAVDSSVAVDNCENINITGSQILGARIRGIQIQVSRVVRVSDCTIRGRENDKSYRTALAVDGNSSQVMVANNFLERGSDGEFALPAKVGVAQGNVTFASQ